MNDHRPPQPLKVILVQRKRGEFWSIEGLFKTIANHLPSEIRTDLATAPFDRARIGPILRNLIWARSLSAEIFHVTGDIHYIILGLRCRRKLLTIHDLRFLEQSRGVKRAILWLIWVYLPCKNALCVTTISNSTRNKLIELGKVDADKIRVIPNCVSPEFKPVSKQWPRDKPVILQIGTTDNKNLERVAAACSGLGVTLWVLGNLTGSQRKLLDQSATKFVSHCKLSQAEVVSLYERCDIVVFASLYEGFGLPILEAQAVGRPVLTSRKSPMQEIAGDGALLVDPTNTQSIRSGLEDLIGNPELREALVSKGFDNVKNYSATHIASQYASLYREFESKIPISVEPKRLVPGNLSACQPK